MFFFPSPRRSNWIDVLGLVVLGTLLFGGLLLNRCSVPSSSVSNAYRWTAEDEGSFDLKRIEQEPPSLDNTPSAKKQSVDSSTEDVRSQTDPEARPLLWTATINDYLHWLLVAGLVWGVWRLRRV